MDKNRKKKKVKGSYTVEAALLMGILMMVFVSIIYLGFYFHDKGFLLGAAYESVCGASLCAEEADYSVADTAGKLTKGRLLGIRGLSVSAEKGEKEAVVSYIGSFSFPGMIRAFFEEGEIQIGARQTASVQRPAKLLQKIRGAVKIINRVRG